jgi:pantoate--beta-alanine ligase
MKIIQSPSQIQQELIKLKQQGKTIGFVPTMGNLHDGHLSLIEIAKQKADIVVCSIFVNPMQFGENEDLDKYPRTLEADTKKLNRLKIDYLFTPSELDIYPQGKITHTSIEVNRMSNNLCGASRPGHFKGVTTVVNILFNIIQPNIAIFGKKDYQQFQIIKAMVKDLMLPIEIVGGEIIREKNGLAMSSRNGFLTEQEREHASLLRKEILDAAEKIKNGEEILSVVEHATHKLVNSGFKIDYFDVLQSANLEPATAKDKDLLIAVAAWLGKPKLLDNIELQVI